MSSAVSMMDASTVCCHGAMSPAKGARAWMRSSTSVVYAPNFSDPLSGSATGTEAPRGAGVISRGCGSG